MTIRIPKPNIADKFLRLLGKRRAVQLPGRLDRLGEHFYAFGIKENFWKALFRPKAKALPDGTIDIFMVEKINLREPDKTDADPPGAPIRR